MYNVLYYIQKEKTGDPVRRINIQEDDLMMYLKNKEAVLEALIEQIKEFEISLNEYQTDVYLYIDDDGNGTIDTFTNVGGNSWLNDDHFTIYRDREHHNTMMDELINGTSYRWLIEELEAAFSNLSGIEKEVFDALTEDLDEDELEDIESIDDLEAYEVEQYLMDHYSDEIEKYYRESFVPDSCMDYIGDTAYNALDDFLETHSFYVYNGRECIGRYENADSAKNAAKDLDDPKIDIEDDRAH